MLRMKDIAKKAGVSRTAVSFVLNDSPQAKTIKPETREKILSLAKSMGYRKNAIARAMITGKTRTLGFISPPPKSHHLSNMLSGVLAATEELDYSIKYMETNPDNPPRKLIDRIVEQRLDGVIIQSYSKLRPLWKLLIENRIPMGAMGNSYPFKKGLRVISDDIAGGILAVKHFVEMGHKRIGHINHGTESGTGKMRLDGYIAGCKKYDLQDSIEATLDISSIKDTDIFDKMVNDLMESNPGITGLYFGNTYLATKGIKSLRKNGYRVPEDISIIGYSLSDLNYGFDPPITAVDQNHFNMGYTAGKRLIEFIESEHEQLFEKLFLEQLPVKLFEGESVSRLS
jgi:DNA-binding LacI/PurR family transcriptional regulator